MRSITFGYLLDKLLYLSRQKKTALAKTLGYDISYISKWTSGKNLPIPKNINSICEMTSKFIVNSSAQEDIKNITGYSYQYFNRRFKEIWNMTPQVYRKRRQLTLIALEIKRNTVTIKESDLAPWTDDSAFLKAFKREFNITPHKYIKEKDFTLQEKIEIPPQVYMDYMLNNHNKSLEEKYESLFCK